MLIRNTEGDYSPAHRSLLEFFVAYKLAAELGVLASDFIEPVQQQKYVNIQAEPKSYHWSSYFQRSLEDDKTITLIPPLKCFVSEDIFTISKPGDINLLAKQ